MKVRLLDATDARAYQRLRLQALQESPTAFSASHADEVGRSLDDVVARITAAADGSVCTFGIFEQDQLAGFVAVIHPQREKLRHAVELAGMYVAPSCRRRGFGRALLQAAVAHAHAIAGVRQIRLGVNASNAEARALYQSIGFTSYGVEPGALQVDGMCHDEAHYVLRWGLVAG
ncbi:N-acetyltransferase [Rhodanobacter panaciterrae]|uniref:N-acetyltransferase n=1 Tax=Rhodanobacter panaciterrae TaxID=490572 RepID=A0ABQ2ZGM8_9GAMM|nr:GNAT family N-acetyltransferase [Rhodanobacter panaciterrae]GGY13641.1 N-acetyltransferase [Rhodanobacter panaciterrae]